jgi:hypothetical protein
MLRPLLIIGAGGSGGKTIRSMKQALKRRLDAAHYKGGLPSAWQFLQIDTTRDGIDFPAPMLPDDEIHLVVKSGDNFESVLNRITATGSLPEQQEMMAGWGIPKSSITITDGAGQIRAIGRQAGVADSKGILSALSNAIGKMKGPTAEGELKEVASALGIQRTSKDPRAFIISSLAGGSGAGMFMDIAELLKRATTDKWATETISFLYTSEVFESLKAAAANVSKNSLGAMNEITASKWVGLTDRTQLLYSKLGLSSSANTRTGEYGCAGNILVGCRNKAGVDLSLGADSAGMDEVFLTIGEALAGALTEEAISEFYFNQAFVNITQTLASIDKSGLAPDPGSSGDRVNPTLAAAAIGFGQMTLGASRIVDFVADALTRKQVKTLLYPDLSPEDLKGGVTKDQLVDARTKNAWPNFLLDSGLDEKGSQNQIIEALYPEGWDKDVNQFVGKLLAASVPSKSVPLNRFCKDLWTEWESESEDFLSGVQKKINACAQKWVRDIQKKFSDHVANELTRSGYYVLTSLVQDLKDELKKEVVPELDKEHRKYAGYVQSFNQALFVSKITELAAGLSGVSNQNNAFIEKVRGFLAKTPTFQIESAVFDIASSLVQDLTENFLDPLIKSMEHARHELKRDVDSNLFEGRKNPFRDFPDWDRDDLPKQYLPRTIERILIDPSKFKDTYVYFAGKDSGGNPPFELSVSYSLLGMRMNTLQRERNEQELVQISNPWNTKVREAQEHIGGQASAVVVNLNTGFKKLGERNREWLRNPDSSFGKFTNLSIRDYVTADHEPPNVKQEREDRFISEFGAMISLSQPLALFNDRAFTHIDSTDGGKPASSILPRSSKIPFKIDSRVGVACVQILKNAGVDVAEGSFPGRWFEPSNNSTAMYSTSTTQASLPAWAFASLTEPILSQVSSSRNGSGTWIQFWEGRRGRPLLEAVPFEPQIRLSIVAGWIIASLFGLREIKRLPIGRTVQIWNPTLLTPGWSNFPAPLLNTHILDNREENWVLPQLLTSAGVALAEFGKTGNFEHLHGYQLLKFLGREVTTAKNNRDNWDDNGTGDLLPTGVRSQSTVIRDWIESNKKPADSRELLAALKERAETGANRSTAIVETIEQIRAQYASNWNALKDSPWYSLPETWELRADLDLVLDDIRDYALESRTSTTGTSV